MRLITGAGVDCTTGIDFPLANTLLADVIPILFQRVTISKGKQ